MTQKLIYLQLHSLAYCVRQNEKSPGLASALSFSPSVLFAVQFSPQWFAHESVITA